MTNKKLLITPFLLIASLIATFSILGIQQIKRRQKEISFDVKNQKDTTTHWRDDFNNEHARNIALQESIQTMKALHGEELSHAAQLLKVKQKQIEGLQKIVATVHGSFTEQVDTTRRGDTTATISHNDEFSTFTTATVDNMESINYKIRVPIVLAPYWQRKHKFCGIRYGKIEHFIDGYSTNPNVTIDSLSDIRIIQKNPGRFGIGPYVGMEFDGSKFRPSVGFSVHYDIVRW
jgi:hypothetical protein